MSRLPLRNVVHYEPAGCLGVVGPFEKRWATGAVSVAGTVSSVIRQVQDRRTVCGTTLSAEDSVLVLASPVAEEPDWAFSAMLSVAAEAGVSAVAVCLLGPRLDLPRGIIQLTERLRMPVIAVRDPWSFGRALVDLLAGASHLEGALVRAMANQCRRPTDSMTELLTRISGTVGHPVRLVDRGGVAIAGPRANCGEVADVVPQAPYEPVGRSIDRSAAAVSVSVPTMHGTAPLLTAAVSNASDAEQQAITAALEVASLAVSEHLSRRRVDLERRARSRAALLSDLLESGPTIAPALYQRARDAGWSLDGYHLAARAIVRGDVDLVGRRADLENALEQEGLDAVTVEQSDGWAMWVTVDSQSEASNAGGLGTLWRRVQQRLSATIPTQLGVGSVHHGAAGLARSLAEAADAARIAAGRERSGYFVQIDRLDLAQRLLAWMSTESFVPAARELLAPLEDRPELMSTLNTYLDTESSLVETAAVLGVHRNTVSDRMARIRHDLAVDLDDPDTRLALQLACRSTVRTAGARQT